MKKVIRTLARYWICSLMVPFPSAVNQQLELPTPLRVQEVLNEGR